MRTRQGFVSNSSSSSFIIVTHSENIHPDVVGDVTWFDEDRVREEIKEVYGWDVVDTLYNEWFDKNPHREDPPSMWDKWSTLSEEEQWKRLFNIPEARELYDYMMDALDAGDFVAEVEMDYNDPSEPIRQHHEIIKEY
jgi:hypothetical protein